MPRTYEGEVSKRFGGIISARCEFDAPGRKPEVEPVTAIDQRDVEPLVEALREAQAALSAMGKTLIAVEGTLKQPYPDDPRWSPWSRFLARSDDSPWPRLCRADTSARAALATFEDTAIEGRIEDGSALKELLEWCEEQAEAADDVRSAHFSHCEYETAHRCEGQAAAYRATAQEIRRRMG